MLENNGITAVEAIELLSAEEPDEQTQIMFDNFRLLGVSAENGRIRMDPVFKSLNPGIRDDLSNLLDALDCKCDYEKTTSKNVATRYLN